MNYSKNNLSEKPHEEYQYLNLIKECMEHGEIQSDRTETGILALFGRSMRFSLADQTLPLITTKKVFYRMVLEELLFFIRGQTDNKILTDKKIGIWTGNSTEEFFKKNNINREAGDLGPVYGFQWRHCGAEYKTCHDDYSGQGIDQLQEVIDTIKNNPTSRRLMVVSWIPVQLKEMALPPCHCLFQFHVANGKLSCILYQRSADMGLGVPFNIASYSILTIMIAKLCNLIPGEFIHFIGNCHVYSNHVDVLKEQLTREPRPFPKLKLKEKEYKSIDDFQFDDFELVDYNPHGILKMKMAI